MLGIKKAQETVKTRVIAPINTAVIVACCALCFALVAILLAVSSAH
jgi:hypothetical protein